MKIAWMSAFAGLMLLVGVPGSSQEKAAPAGEAKPAAAPMDQRKLDVAAKDAEAVLGHLKAIFRILKDNKDDCDRAVTTVEHYLQENDQALRALARRIKKLEKTLTPEEDKVYKQHMDKLVEPLMKDSMPAVMAFAEKCPEHMSKIGEAMKFLDEAGEDPPPKKPAEKTGK